MTLFRSKRVFGAKLETTPGTPQSLTVTDAALNIFDAIIEPDLTFESRAAQGGFGTISSHHTGLVGKSTFSTEFAYNGTDIPTWADRFFPACGLVKVSRKFVPRSQAPDTPSADVKCITLGLWSDGKYQTLYGAAGTAKIICRSGAIARIDWEFSGILGPEIDASLIAPDYPAETKLRCSGGVCSYNSVAMCLETLTIDLGGQLYRKPCSNAAAGYDFALVANRMAKATGNPESRLVAQQNRMGMLFDGTVAPLRYVLPAPGYDSMTGEHSVEILAGFAQLKKNTAGERENVQIDDLEWDFNIDPANVDNEFSIEFKGAA